MSLYVKGLQNCSQGVPHSIQAHSFAGLWLPETYSTSLEKSNTYWLTYKSSGLCWWRVWVLYGTLKQPKFTSSTGKRVVLIALHCNSFQASLQKTFSMFLINGFICKMTTLTIRICPTRQKLVKLYNLGKFVA